VRLIRTKADRKGQPAPATAVRTPDAVRRLGLTTDVETAGAILGIGRTKAYQLAKSGHFPVPLFRAGRRYLVPVPALLRLLGAITETGTSEE
jgi:hypothetical protein